MATLGLETEKDGVEETATLLFHCVILIYNVYLKPLTYKSSYKVSINNNQHLMVKKVGGEIGISDLSRTKIHFFK